MPYVDVNQTTLHYRVEGSGPTAVFVHGYPLDSTLWLDQLDALSDVRTCVAVDLRGHGLSEPTTLTALTMEQHADDVAALVGALGGGAVDLVGLSMGGYVALAFAERHGQMLRSLALVDTKATADSEAGKAGRDNAAVKVVVQGRHVLAADMMEPLLSPKASQMAKARLRSMIEASRYETITGALMGMKDRPDRSAVLPGITVPVAIVVGEDDGVTPPSGAEAMAAAIPGAEVTTIPGAGHLTPIEKPAAVNDALRALFARAG
jgi:3-oxoadipate enol-lactonase